MSHSGYNPEYLYAALTLKYIIDVSLLSIHHPFPYFYTEQHVCWTVLKYTLVLVLFVFLWDH
jgi:hypothetical protein